LGREQARQRKYFFFFFANPEKGGKMKILLVDDDEFVLDLYSVELQKAGFVVFTTSDPFLGLSKMELENPDLVLLDVAMPEMTGLQFLKKARATPSIAKIPIVFLTNVRDDEVIKEGLTKGAIGYLIKPALTPAEVVEEVKNFLSQTKD
jgi:two-component system OmpR family response regulator